MNEADSFSTCLQKLHEQFKVYDRTVDVVCCWQFLFNQVSPYRERLLAFDRFPRMKVASSESEEPKTPDFAVLCSESYGLIVDVKEGVPRDDENFVRTMSRLKKYDQPLRFRLEGLHEGKIPNQHDIALIVPYRDAQEIVNRLEKKRHEGALVFERSLIVFEWSYDVDLDEYVFRKVAGQSAEFRDHELPEEMRLSSIFSVRGASLKVSPDKFKAIKAVWQFCNDKPPVIYALTFLWTKIFYHLLSETQRETWRRRDSKKQMPIKVTVHQVAKEIEDRYALKWGHWVDWVREALDALVQAGLATRGQEKDHYVVNYRNLIREIGPPQGQLMSREGRFRPTDYARILATHICRGAKSSVDQTPLPGGTLSLFDR